MRLQLWLIILTAVVACKGDPYSSVSDEQLHEQARTLALPERYDFYVAVYSSQLPPRSILAEDVAALGPSAWKYTINRALSGGSVELSQALPVLSAFNRRCSLDELTQLVNHAQSGSSANTSAALKERIETMCGGGLPASD